MFNIFKKTNKCAGCGMSTSSDAIKRGDKLFCSEHCVKQYGDQGNNEEIKSSKDSCCG